MSVIIPIAMLVVAIPFFRRSFLKTKARMDTEVRDVV